MNSPYSNQIEIQIEDISGARALKRFMEQKIQRWVFPDGTVKSPEYNVSFQKIGTGHTVLCHLEIYDGHKTWTSSKYGKGPHEALASCLSYLSAHCGTRLKTARRVALST